MNMSNFEPLTEEEEKMWRARVEGDFHCWPPIMVRLLKTIKDLRKSITNPLNRDSAKMIRDQAREIKELRGQSATERSRKAEELVVDLSLPYQCPNHRYVTLDGYAQALCADCTHVPTSPAILGLIKNAKEGWERAEKAEAREKALLEALKPEHHCKIIARAPMMNEGRDIWIGNLTEPVLEWPEETHCLHIKTPLKDIVLLINLGDRHNLAMLIYAVDGSYDEGWLNRWKKEAVKAALSTAPPGDD